MQTHSNLKQSEQLIQACCDMSLELTDQQQKTLLDYLSQLLKWNKTYNLTAIKDPEQALIQHIFDSLAVIEPLQGYIKKKKLQQTRILDVGSGPGLPGVVIATMLTDTDVICVDTVEKKMAFVRQVIGILGLTNVKAIHQRVEQLKIEPFDIVTSRAFSSLQEFVELSGEKVKKGGAMLAMKGKRPQLEIEALESNTQWCVDSIQELKVPKLDAQRCLVWMKRKGTS